MHSPGSPPPFPHNLMSNSDSDGPSNNEWEDRGELAWNEFDWERYLREQDASIARYRKLYEANAESPNRIDKVAEQMGWSIEDWTEEGGEIPDSDDDDEEEDDVDFDDEDDVYTLHKNPIFISTKAIIGGLQEKWLERASLAKLPVPVSMALLNSLHRSEDQSAQAIHALDFGDYAMAISLFKRALNLVNSTFALLNSAETATIPAIVAFREHAQPALFDLREIWLRVISECREEIERPQEADDDDDKP